MCFCSLSDWSCAYDEGENALCISYGKDSLACVKAIKILGWKLDRIIHAEVWATDTIPADLPPVIEFKKRVDSKIKAEYGIEVEHVKADTTYEECFYRKYAKGKNAGKIWGFPFLNAPWCNGYLKMGAIKKIKIGGCEYIGIAADEAKRFKVLNNKKLSPLKEIGWEEDMCGLMCQYDDILSPTYDNFYRDGCWFCHNQGIDQLRHLRKNYPQYWELMLKWDTDSPVAFKGNGLTVHDYDRRFEFEDKGYVPIGGKFKWKMLNEPQQIKMIF